MKKQITFLILVAVMLIFCSCAGTDAENDSTLSSTNETSTADTPNDSDTLPDDDEQEITLPDHSELYLPEYSAQQIFEYFEEVVLRAEYFDGVGDTTLVQKWNEPIRFDIYGDYTEKDIAVLNDVFARLNEIEGFPGIYAAGDGTPENVTISFLEPEDFFDRFSTFINGEDAYGVTRFWYYTDTNEIYTADIGYRTDVDQTTRISILLEEIVNMLGVSDTVMREDSIVYQYSNENFALSDVDWVILKLLYDPSIKSGSNFEQCSEIVQKLYY